MKRTILVLFLCASFSFADTLILRDGSRHNGRLESTNDQYVIFSEGGDMPRRYSRDEVRAVEFNSGTGSSANANSRDNTYNSDSSNNRNNTYDRDNNDSRYGSNTNPPGRDQSYNGPVNSPANSTMNGSNSVSLPEGTDIIVRTDQAIDSQNATEGQLYPAEVSQDVKDDAGNIIIPKGSQAELAIRNVAQRGTVTGTSELALGLDSVNVNGNTYRVSTQDVSQQGNSGIGKNKRTGEYVGGGAVLGTLIGAIAGGGKGAAIGAIAGAGAGAGAQVLTRGKAVKVPAETVLHFRLDQPLQLNPGY
jgi:hypothetical protein